MSGEDRPRTGIANATGYRFSPTSKALQIQVMSAATDEGGGAAETCFADAFQGWYMVAVPPTQDVDALGTISGSTEFLTEEVGDRLIMHGSRDVRVARHGQDVRPGEFALINQLGYRFFCGKKSVSIIAGGGYLNFDVEHGKVGLVGIPSSPGGRAPYLSLDGASAGLVSASAEASLVVAEGSATVTGKTVSLDGSRVNLGVGASDPVVVQSQLMQLVAQLVVQVNAMVAIFNGHLPPPAVPMVPLVIVMVPGRSVFALPY